MAEVPQRVDPRRWAAPSPTGWRRWLPILTWLPGYDRRLLRFDLVAGATVWGLLIPEMIAYAGLAGLPPEAGLYTLLATLTAYAVFGTSRHVVAGGTSAAAVLLASAVSDRAPGSAEEYAALGAALVLLCGGMFLIAGLLRLGFIAQFLSRPVIEGFVFGLAVFVTVNQLPKLLGIEAGGGDTINQFVHIVVNLGDSSAATAAVGAATLVVLFVLDRVPHRLPGGLIVLVGGILVSAALNLSEHGVRVVGAIPSGLPSVGLPDVATGDWIGLAAAASGMVLVIFSESLGTAEAFAAKYGYDVDPNQELIALAAVNTGSGLVGGLAGGGSLSQSAVNERAGARSELSPIFAAALAVVTLVLLTPVFKNLPETVLAALIIHAVSHLWKIPVFRRYYGERRTEFWLGIATLTGVIVINVLPGLAIGVVSMLVLFVYQASRPHVGVLGRIPGVPGAYGHIRRHPDYEQLPGLLVARLDAPLFYANALPVGEQVKALVGSAQPTPRAVILDIGANSDLDITSAEMLRALTGTLHAAGIEFALAEAHTHVREMARRSGLLRRLGPENVFRTVDEAVEALLEVPGARTPART